MEVALKSSKTSRLTVLKLQVIYTIFTDFTLQVQNQLANMPVLNLAYTDLITTGVCSLLGTIVIFFDGNPFGDIVCGVWAYTNLLGLITTIGILAVISFDRFIVWTIALIFIS